MKKEEKAKISEFLLNELANLTQTQRQITSSRNTLRD